MALQQRLLRDIAEFSKEPYPNIFYIPNETDMTRGCLVLNPEAVGSIHLSVEVLRDFPLAPPNITCNSNIHHPNVFGSYICASILNTQEGWTPAYTLKGIAIQLLSFFSSDSLQQDYGSIEDLRGRVRLDSSAPQHRCFKCGFGTGTYYGPPLPSQDPATNHGPSLQPRTLATNSAEIMVLDAIASRSTSTPFAGVPNEILVQICDHLDDNDLINFARAWDRVGGAGGVINRFNVMRNRELICFALKKSFKTTMLGIGVGLTGRGTKRTLESEFDLLSLEAFEQLRVGRSVQGLPFDYWLPLAISERHYSLVKKRVHHRLMLLSTQANLHARAPVEVIYHFMNDVIVKLSQESSSTQSESGRPASSLRHASEKAIESFYHLFHLLLCLAGEDKTAVTSANKLLQGFKAGANSKSSCPNLGHLLLAVLISDVAYDQVLAKAIIKEAITRNVVWMLDCRGADMPDLAYLEPDEVSEYRLSRTFAASTTSYRLLMFFNLFRGTVNRRSGPGSLDQLRKELFSAHGAPPFGAAATLAARVQAVQKIESFDTFLVVMGVQDMPGKATFTKILRESVEASMKKGYSVWGCNQEVAKRIREAGGTAGFRVGSFFPRRR